jgi:hypothetical protein
MTNEMHIYVVETMKNQVKDGVEFLISKLQSHFSFTWCYGSFWRGLPSILDDGRP